MAICGIDEAGRGPWAGPVVAAAIILPARGRPKGLKDSKLLSPEARESLAAALQTCAEIGVGLATPEEIDALNILKATHLAMQRALAALPGGPTAALIDGDSAPPLDCAVECIIDGDAHVPLISAASIIAKVERDRMMAVYCETYPGYGFSRHKGYGTAEHQAALARLGPSPIHRLSFKPVKAALAARHVSPCVAQPRP